ncbi:MULTISPECIES: NAD(P)-dependent oxidoreductase [Streptomyces]|uniref:NAD(P)-dependent oxidoreductase n=1 Tax=Streptomyces TaxID=1883 RepID=UPI0022A9373C|nr:MULTISPECIES: NAD(P)-binding domain-containing protein [Streptomyces]UFQ17295.1 NAD(P)-binding domain-containing protein [Streptomyces huasconensis]WCL86900.1 NAD(P)-binding domain-containing protein [Streptomyces sp. JCM 35825]
MPSSTEHRASVTVLGLGLMGTALAAALLKAGHDTTVWNRTASKTGPLAAQGATPADTAAEAIAASPLVIVCLTTNDNVRGLLEAEADALAGRTVVNLTNGTPAQARELAEWAAGRGITYIDGGIMAVPQMIATPAAYILYSGTDEDAYETHRPTLAALADTKWVGKDPGAAALYDLSLLTGMYGMVMGVAQAYALIGSGGVPARDFAPLLKDWVNAMTDGLVPGMAEALDSGQHLTDVSSLAVNQAALPNFLTTFAQQGLRTDLFEPLQALLDRSIDEGHAADGLSRLVTLIKKD